MVEEAKGGQGGGDNGSNKDHRKLGFWSAVFLIFNRIVGTGIFTTPGAVVALSGSVGLSLVMWMIGIIMTFAGAFVYLEFGTGIPKNGGEKNYLEFVFTRPKFLATTMFASQALLLGWAGSSSVVFGEAIMHTANVEPTRWSQRGLGMAGLTAAFLIHGCAPKWGLKLQNVMGCIKMGVLLLIVMSGFVALGGHVKLDEKPHNFSNTFEGTTASAYGIVTALYNVMWCLIGYNNANYVLSETKDPVRTLKRALPAALGLVSVLFIFINIAYFAAIPKAEIMTSKRMLVVIFFRNVMGKKAERFSSACVALSSFGNVLGMLFSNGRLVQEVGREGILPFSKFWASNKPFNAPLAGLFEHWCVSALIVVAPPPGDAFDFILNVISYPYSVINLFVAIGLVQLYFKPFSLDRYPQYWSPPFRATLPVVVFFLLSNLFLVVAPFVPPGEGQNVYETLPYWLHCVVGLGVFLLGGIYWVVWAHILPKLGKYDLIREETIGEDGMTQGMFVKRPKTL